MSLINATANYEKAKKLTLYGTVRAVVQGRTAIVRANVWDPITRGTENPSYTITARAIREDVEDKESQGTQQANAKAQRLIDGLKWDPWPK